MYHWFCKYQHVNFFSNVVKYIRPTYSNKEVWATLIGKASLLDCMLWHLVITLNRHTRHLAFLLYSNPASWLLHACNMRANKCLIVPNAVVWVILHGGSQSKGFSRHPASFNVDWSWNQGLFFVFVTRREKHRMCNRMFKNKGKGQVWDSVTIQPVSVSMFQF